MKQYIIKIVLLVPILSFAQDKVEGMIMEANTANKHIPLSGANVYWLNTQIGTVTNENGLFSISYKPEYKKLIISHVGFKIDTLTIDAPKTIHHFLQPTNQLDEIVVEKGRKPVQKSYFEAQNIVTVNSEELLKAACCNLAESFETNPSIDVNFSDALTGTKQIQMLGLTSPYLLITQENIPSVRGASQAYGLTFTPGTWIESIQITKGAGSVINGFESISGQINAELVKPFTDDRFFVNAYANRNGRYELNAHINQKINEKWQTGLYLHGNLRTEKVDNNNDEFLDAPLANQINVMNRWQYQNPQKGWVSFFNVHFVHDDKQLGETTFNPNTDKFTMNAWGSEIQTNRFQTAAKVGYVFPELPYQSVGFQVAFSNHDQNSYYGFNQYNIQHQSIYSNALFNSIIGNSLNKFKLGLSATYDAYKEDVNTDNYNRIENSVGAFFEYVYDDLENINLSAGIRLDNHNRLGTFITPRVHLRYTPWKKGTLRASFGRGKRSANIFAENQQLFATSRQVQILDTDGEIYGLNPEIAWNYGLSFLQGFYLFERNGDVTIDFYRTDFQNQVVVDWENPQEINFYNLDGKSYANSLQIELNYELFHNLNFRTAYKYYDVKTTYNLGDLQRALTPKHRFFANVSYETIKKENGSQWKFDYTFNSLSKQRLPDTSGNPVQYQLDEFSPSYSLMNAQITRVFSNRFEVYIGGENLTNVTQENPILANDDPFGVYFDSSIVYAPILGNMYYAGLRFKIN